jgi:hypothetical protein
MADFYSSLYKLEEHNPVFVLDRSQSLGDDNWTRMNMSDVWKMCEDVSALTTWHIVPQPYCDHNTRQRSCRILILKGQSDMTGGDHRVDNESVIRIQAFIRGWMACNKRRPKKKKF